MKKVILLISTAIVVLLSGCGSPMIKNDAGILNVDPGDDKTAYVGETVVFEGDCAVKTGIYEPEAEWDFGDGFGEEGFEATHVYTAPGEYSVDFTVTISAYSISVTESIIVTILPLPMGQDMPGDDTEQQNTGEGLSEPY